jgi:hypothetical protein
MIKGVRKNVIFLRCDKESPFESVFFVLKNADSEQAVVEIKKQGGKNADDSIIAAANAIISEAIDRIDLADSFSSEKEKHIKKEKRRRRRA